MPHISGTFLAFPPQALSYILPRRVRARDHHRSLKFARGRTLCLIVVVACPGPNPTREKWELQTSAERRGGLKCEQHHFSPPASSRRCGAEGIDVSRRLKPLGAKCSVLLLQSDCLFLMKRISSTCPPWNNIISLRSNWLPKPVWYCTGLRYLQIKT